MEYVWDVSLWTSLLQEHDYELLGQLDSGSFSDVFAVRNKTSHRVLAVKRMVARREIASDPRILKEIACLKQLSMGGACVIRIEGMFWQLDRLACLVLELAPMGDLERHTVENWPLSSRLVTSTVRQVLSALTHCHRLHIAHRDLNPANVLLMSERSVRLADFGLAFQCRDSSGGQLLCEDYLGRDSYLAPEVLLCTPYDAVPADMWSMSSLCWFLLTGKHPLSHRPSPATRRDCDKRPSTGKDCPQTRTPSAYESHSSSAKGYLSAPRSTRCRRHSSRDSEGSCRSESDVEDSVRQCSVTDVLGPGCVSVPSSCGEDSGQWEGEADHLLCVLGAVEEDVFKQPTATDYALLHLMSRLRLEKASDRLKAEDALTIWKNTS